jgi:ActR/RegA family two-component response regulator
MRNAMTTPDPLSVPQFTGQGLVLVVDDDERWVNDCCQTLENLGYAAVPALSIAASYDELATKDIWTAIVDYRMPDGNGLSLIYALSARSALRSRKLNFVLVTAYPSLEMAVQAIRASVVDMLIKPFSSDALDAALWRVRTRESAVAPVEPLATHLLALSNEMRRITQLVEGPGAAAKFASTSLEGTPTQFDGALVRRLIRVEQSRARVVGGKLLGDPAWNILLDLLLASLENRKVSVSSACIVAGVATTTALRLVNRMVEDGVLERLPDQKDRRRDFLVIRPEVQAALKDYLIDLSKL